MVRAAQKKTLDVGGFAEPSKEAASKAVKAKKVAAYYGGIEAEKRRQLKRDLERFNKTFGGDPAVDKFNPKGTGMGDRFDPTAKNFFSPKDDGKSVVKSDINTSVFAGAESGTNFAVANNANDAVNITNQTTANLADASYDTTYKQEKGYAEDSYEKIKQIFDKPKKDDFKTTVEKRFSKSMYGGEGISEEQAIDTFRRKNLDYETGTDFFGDKVNYSPETIKRYIATDAKEKYEKDQAFKRTQQLNEARKIAAQERKKIDDKAYFRAMQKFDEPSITQKVSNFVFGTDLKGKEDPRNINLLTKDERLSTLRSVERAYQVPGISVDQYGIPTVPYDKINPDTKFKTRTPDSDSQLTGEDFKTKEDIERKKIFREQAGLSPNPNLMERTTKFLGDVIGGVSRIFTPAAQAGGLEGMPSRGSLANTFTSGQSLGVSDASSFGGLSGLPSSMGDNISAGISGMQGNIATGMQNFGRNIDAGISNAFGSGSGSFAASRGTSGISQGLSNRIARNKNVKISGGKVVAANNTGVARAQASAFNRQISGTSISAQKAKNVASIKARAKAKHKAFKAKQRAFRRKKKKSKKGKK